jgi:hypothetical protein
MTRRRPQTLERWALGLVGTVIIALVIYELRMARLDARLEHSQSAVADMMSKLSPQTISPPAARQLTPEEIHRAREAEAARAATRKADDARQAQYAAEQAHKDAAWEKYYSPNQSCIYPESPNRVKVCGAQEAKLRARFEQQWASGNTSPGT